MRDEKGFLFSSLIFHPSFLKHLERETRLELATSTLARSRSTTELFPLAEFPILPIEGFLSSESGGFVIWRRSNL